MLGEAASEPRPTLEPDVDAAMTAFGIEADWMPARGVQDDQETTRIARRPPAFTQTARKRSTP